MKVIFSEEEKHLEKQMDRFDAMIHEYLRSNRKTVEYLATKVGCDPSSLWRYRRQVRYFQICPMDVLSGCFRMANASNETIRIVLGLPTGKQDE